MYTWLPLYKELANWILTYRNKQNELCNILRKIEFEGNLEDEDKAGRKTPLMAMDPFTFFSFFMKIKNLDNRTEYFKKLKKVISLKSKIPEDYNGVPSAQPMRLWYFRFEGNRPPEVMDNLWDLAGQAVAGRLKEEAFQYIFERPGIRIAKLSQGLFWLNPEEFYPIDAHKNYLEEKGINTEVESLSDYLGVLERVKAIFQKPFYEVSYEAWRNNHEEVEDNGGINEFDEALSPFEEEEINGYRLFLRKIIQHFHIPSNDERVVFSCKQNRLSFITGQRYALTLRKEKEAVFGFISQNKLPFTVEDFTGTGPAAFYNNTNKSSEMLDSENEILAAIKIELDRTSVSGMYGSDNSQFRNWAFHGANFKQEIMSTNQPLNQILYGPPGTGKTYHTIDKAIEIIDKEFFEANKLNRRALTTRFNELLIKDLDKLEGQIAFCTFHQSMSYEDFVEGIKPELSNGKNENIGYTIKDGIFKIIARMASDALEEKETKKQQAFHLDDDDLNQAIFYKMSLGNTQLEGDEEIYDYCIENNCIVLGWGANLDYLGMDENEIFKATKDGGQSDFSAQQVNMFIHYVKPGNYIIVSNGNHRFRAIGRVTGNYEYRKDSPIQGYYHFKKVEWLLRNVDLPVSDIYNRNFQQQTLYKLKQQEIKKSFFVPAFLEKQREAEKKESLKFVIVIDEINRGNVSQIFGELITLIEEDKRWGNKETITATLPYSKKIFSVPPNLYIVGTMNTADRSVEALDTALRRRFAFELVEADTTLLKPTNDGINLPLLLQTINRRIEALLTKDHCIGHAWLMQVNDVLNLQTAFKEKILPLLCEFFYNDYAKIGLILGDAFVLQDKVTKGLFAKFDDVNELAADYEDKIIYTLKDPFELDVKDFQSIYQ